MKALTIWQPWATLIIEGLKPFEFRGWQAPRFVRGQRIVIHASARKVPMATLDELLDAYGDKLHGSTGFEGDLDKARHLLTDVKAGHVRLPLAAGLGTAVLGEPKRCIDLFASRMDPDQIDPAMWAWPLTQIEKFAKPIPASGAQQFWDWKPLQAAGALL